MSRQFTDNSERVIKTLRQKQIDALKEIAKMLRKKARIKLRRYKRTGNLSKMTQTWVKRKGKVPSLQFGTKPKAWYGQFFEFGSDKHEKRSYIEETTRENINEIESITKKHLGDIK